MFLDLCVDGWKLDSESERFASFKTNRGKGWGDHRSEFIFSRLFFCIPKISCSYAGMPLLHKAEMDAVQASDRDFRLTEQELLELRSEGMECHLDTLLHFRRVPHTLRLDSWTLPDCFGIPLQASMQSQCTTFGHGFCSLHQVWG